MTFFLYLFESFERLKKVETIGAFHFQFFLSIFTSFPIPLNVVLFWRGKLSIEKGCLSYSFHTSGFLCGSIVNKENKAYSFTNWFFSQKNYVLQACEKMPTTQWQFEKGLLQHQSIFCSTCFVPFVLHGYSMEINDRDDVQQKSIGLADTSWRQKKECTKNRLEANIKLSQ